MKKTVLLSFLIGLVVSISAQNDDKDIIINALKNEIKELERQKEEIRLEYEKAVNTNPNRSRLTEEYRIQLGVNSGNNLINIGPDHRMNGAYINGKFVYDIGGFVNPQDAFNLSQDMRKLNLAGAFVTRYVNGVRDFNFKYEGTSMPIPAKNQVNFIMPTTVRTPKKADDGVIIDQIPVVPTSGKKGTDLVIED
jgi:hypothetical protein